jgi:hypothetical protein
VFKVPLSDKNLEDDYVFEEIFLAQYCSDHGITAFSLRRGSRNAGERKR